MPEQIGPSEEEVRPQEELVGDIKKRLLVRDMPEEYSKFIKPHMYIEMSDSYTEIITNYFWQRGGKSSETYTYMQEKFKDQTVLDLGCGYGEGLQLTDEFKAREYIGVDVHPRRPDFITIKGLGGEDSENSSRLTDDSSKRKTGASFDSGIFVEGDMLNVISRLADESVGVIIIAGIQRHNQGYRDHQAYEEAMKFEINRVLKDGGITVNNSAFIGSGFENESFKAVEFKGDPTHTVFYEKMQSGEEVESSKPQ